jgi:hypothetical protein
MLLVTLMKQFLNYMFSKFPASSVPETQVLNNPAKTTATLPSFKLPDYLPAIVAPPPVISPALINLKVLVDQFAEESKIQKQKLKLQREKARSLDVPPLPSNPSCPPFIRPDSSLTVSLSSTIKLQLLEVSKKISIPPLPAFNDKFHMKRPPLKKHALKTAEKPPLGYDHAETQIGARLLYHLTFQANQAVLVG